MDENRDITISLSYYNSCLRLSDIDILKSNSWLNDKCITFYFEYMERKVFIDVERFLFVSPEIT